MNNFEGGPPGKEYANWKAPDSANTETEQGQEYQEFKVFDPPEIPEDGTEDKIEKEDITKHIIKDAMGNEIFHRETTEQSDWQKKMTRDEQGRLSQMEIQKLTPGKESHTKDKFEYDELGQATKTGSIESGQDAGHVYKELPIVEKNLGEGKVIKTITTEIIEQGNNGSGTRAEKGTVFTKEVFMQYGQWLGDKVTGTDGTENTFLPNGAEELPNWE